MSDFLMPSLGADMESARVVEWLVKPGDSVKRGDVIVVVETDKGAIEIEVFDDAVVEELVAPLDAELAVGALLARLRGKHETPAPAPAPRPSTPHVAPMAVVPPLQAPRAMPPAPGAPTPGRPAASPAARRRADERGLDLATIRGSGPGGAVLLADVEAVTPKPRRPGGFDRAAMRRAIGAAMARAKREIPHYYLAQDIDFGPAQAWLTRANASRPVDARLLPAVLLLRAVGRAVARVPALNGHFIEGAFRPGDGVHVGWAVALRGGGLIAPAIHHVDRLTIDELMAALRDVVQRARGGGLRGSELMDATITVTNLGERGADSVLPIIHPPQVAMVGFGRVVMRPWVVEDQVVPRPVVRVSLAGDHRVSDGHQGSALLAEIEKLLLESAPT